MISTINAFQSTDGIERISSGIYNIIKSTDKNQPIQAESIFRYEYTDPQVREIQNKRFRFLLRLYELRDRESLKDRQAIGNELGFDKSTLNEISNYYLDKYFIEYPTTGSVEITVWGMDYVEELMADNIDVQTIKSNRNKVLKRLYELRTESERIDMFPLGEEFGIDKKATLDIMNYLIIKNLIKGYYHFVSITTEGIDYVENNLL
jgi:hypothetical protein